MGIFCWPAVAWVLTPAILSTTFPIDRGDYREVLSHKKSAVDLSRAPLPLPIRTASRNPKRIISSALRTLKANTSPNSVTYIPSLRRSKKVASMEISSLAIAWVIAGCERKTFPDALLILLDETTALNARKCLIFGIFINLSDHYFTIKQSYSISKYNTDVRKMEW